MNFLFFEESSSASSADAGTALANLDWPAFWTAIRDWCVNYGLKLLLAIVIIFLGSKIINLVGRAIEKHYLSPKPKKEKVAETQETPSGEKKVKKVVWNTPKPVDKTLVKTLVYVGKVALKVLIVVAMVSFVGINTSAISSLIASLTVCVGLAVNGTVSNLAGGFMLMVTRPFSVDDYIQVGDYSGTVEEIRVVFTTLRTPDNKVIHLPNGTLSTSTIANYSEKETRRLEIIFGISYDSDFEVAKNVILEEANKHPLVLKDPAPTCRLAEEADSSLNLTMRVWTKNADYWTVNFDLQESIYKALVASGISIPYPQMDVHVKND